MNVNSGGPHILLFERDQQLTGLLMSEFQLAGYEGHAARTAVEVFDAIARYPIRLVLVNLAQAAANRREFWVALDAQRRGRGVQVFTFRCMNLAGYGPDDPDERSRAVLTDMEVDGMLGVMNLVDAVRARIPGSTSMTGSFSRLAAGAGAGNSAQEAPRLESLERTARQSEADARVSQSAAPLPAMMSPNSAAPVAPMNQSDPGLAARTGMPAPTFTDKIRAVIYPGNRSYSPTPENNWAPHAMPPVPPSPRNVSSPDVAIRPQVNPNAGAAGSGIYPRETLTDRQTGRGSSVPPTPTYQNVQAPTGSATNTTAEGTGLEQLSRMVRENTPAWSADAPPANTGGRIASQPVTASAPVQDQGTFYKGPQTDQVVLDDNVTAHINAQPPAQTQTSAPRSISDMPLRPSPIEDLPIERPAERHGVLAGSQTLQTGEPEGLLSPTSPLPVVNQAPAAKVVVPPTPVVQTEVQEENNVVRANEGLGKIEAEQNQQSQMIDRLLVERSPVLPSQTRGQTGPIPVVTSEDMLLNIVQSLPPMPALPTIPQQTPVLSGRATRSLGNVLLEGHLVPQHRLEVAQNIQRMLRGVDLNYQLGEILLMFKLLTPDQLLAASLVSYGLISAAQISGLGRIRQELHAIGLEYDLESLVVLFRILTTDQLREVRASWSS